MPLISVRENGNISVPEKMTDIPAWCRLLAAKINQIIRGKTNNVGEVTLNASSTTTTVSVAIGDFGEKTVFLFDPTTDNAAQHMTSKFYVSSRSPETGQYVITHSSAPHTDMTYRVAYVG